MKKSELLRALQMEIQKHNLSTYMHERHKVVTPGCSYCRKDFGTRGAVQTTSHGRRATAADR